MWPFLYFAGDRLTEAELRAALLDGDLVDIGEGFMPADAVETPEMRAASLLPLTGGHRALTHVSAAWVYGVRHEPPLVHTLQRATTTRASFPLDARVQFRDLALPEADVTQIGGVLVTTPVRTFVDLVRRQVATGTADATIAAFLRWRPSLREDGLRWLDACGPVHHKRPARDELLLGAARGAARDQDAELRTS